MQAKEIINKALKENKNPGSKYLLNILKNEANYQEKNFVVIDVQTKLKNDEDKPSNHYDVIFRNGIVTVKISVDANTFKLNSTHVSNLYIGEPYIVEDGTLDIKELFNYLD